MQLVHIKNNFVIVPQQELEHTHHVWFNFYHNGENVKPDFIYATTINLNCDLCRKRLIKIAGFLQYKLGQLSQHVAVINFSEVKRRSDLEKFNTAVKKLTKKYNAMLSDITQNLFFDDRKKELDASFNNKMVELKKQYNQI